MPETVECPKCKRKSKVPDALVGQEVECPGCGESFIAGAGGRPIPTGSFSDEGGAPQAGDERRQGIDPFLIEERYEELGNWRRVRTGLTLMCIWAILLISVVVFVCCLGCSFGMQGMQNPEAEPAEMPELQSEVLAAMVLVVWLAGLVISLVSHVFCVFAPPRRGARTLAITSLSLLILWGILQGATMVTNMEFGPDGELQMANEPGQIDVLEVVSRIVQVIQIASFLCFMRAVCLCINSVAIGQTIILLLILVGATLLTFLGMVAIVQANPGLQEGILPDPGEALTLSMCCFGFFFLLLGDGIWYIIALFQVRNRLDRYILLLEHHFGE